LVRKSKELRKKAAEIQDDEEKVDLLTWQAAYLIDEAINIENGIIAEEDYDRL